MTTYINIPSRIFEFQEDLMVITQLFIVAKMNWSERDVSSNPFQWYERETEWRLATTKTPLRLNPFRNDRFQSVANLDLSCINL